MIKNPPQLVAEPIMAGVNPRYKPIYPSCFITPRIVQHIVRGLSTAAVAAEDGALLVVVVAEQLVVVIGASVFFLRIEVVRRLSSTCIRTLTRSSGYNSIVEAEPPAMPARKEESGLLFGVEIDVLLVDFVDGCGGCVTEEVDIDDFVVDSFMVVFVLCNLFTYLRVCAALCPQINMSCADHLEFVVVVRCTYRGAGGSPPESQTLGTLKWHLYRTL